jgi:hypothetical protein
VGYTIKLALSMERKLKRTYGSCLVCHRLETFCAYSIFFSRNYRNDRQVYYRREKRDVSLTCRVHYPLIYFLTEMRRRRPRRDVK